MTRVAGSILVAVLAVVAFAQTTAAQTRPNVVLIVSDDAGYADFSMHGSSLMATPRIDSIATGGVRFTQGYVSASVCSPSRAGLLTGRYQQRFGHEFNIPPRKSETNGLPVDETTIADVLRGAGYRTIALGKWHLGYADHFHPLSRGFDDYFGFLQGARSYWPIEGNRLNRLLRDRTPTDEDFAYMTDALGAEAAAYIERHRDEPFFLYLSYNAVHTPMHALEDDLAAVPGDLPKRRRQLAAMTAALDRSVGTVLDALEASGVADRTLVVFVNDNGGATNNASVNTPLRGKKGSPFEGGIRVPFAARWPRRLPAGLVYDAPVSTLDLAPTLFAAAGVRAPPTRPLDGVDLVPFVTGVAKGRPHDTLHWRRGTKWAVRHGDWKLLDDGSGVPLKLFDLAGDAGETSDLAPDEPERVERLRTLHESWSAELAEPRWRTGRRARKTTAAPPPPPPPNVLWIIGEDLGPELSCAGTPEVRTPNLDRLAAEGVRYTRAFTTAPVCSASRSAFMTGMYQTTIGAHNHRSHRGDGFVLPEGVHLITDRLRERGYTAANIRHLSSDPEDAFHRGTGKTDWNFAYEGDPFDTDRWDDLKTNQPFFAQVNFSETHRGRAWNEAHRHIEHPADPEKVVVPPYYPDHPVVRADWARYLSAVMALDRKVGFVLDRLAADGLAENTIVVFLADHGRAMVRGKQWCYDSGLHVPLIVRWPTGRPTPRGFTPGTTDDRLVAAIDITATTLDLAGAPPPPTMQGRVFIGKHATPPRRFVFGARDRCDETVLRIRTVRTARYRYIRNFMAERPFLELNRYKEWSYPVLALMRRLYEAGELEELPERLFAPSRPPEELYDLDADPYETVNLVDDAKHRKTLVELRAALDAWIVETNDQGRLAEPRSVVKTWRQRMKERYDERLRERER